MPTTLMFSSLSSIIRSVIDASCFNTLIQRSGWGEIRTLDHLCVRPESITYDKQAFLLYLQNVKNQELDTAKDNASFIGTFVKSGKSAVDFINSYTKPNSYNNALNALKHYCDFLNIPRPSLKQKRRSPDSLIIPPKPEEMHRVIREIKDLDVKTYVGLCSTVGLRPQRLMKARWLEIDFVNGFVNINERHGKKVYRPNPLHKDVAKLMLELKKTAQSDRIFTFAYKKVAKSLKIVNTNVRPNNCRDFFYNQARRSGVDKDLVDWLAGHSIGIRAHYLADTIKEEYSKFEKSFKIFA